MTQRRNAMVTVVCGLLCAGGGAAAAQDAPQTPAIVIQSDEDSREAETADDDRMEAEEADLTREHRERRRRERLQLEADFLDDLREDADDASEDDRLETERLTACRASLPREQAMMIEQISRHYDLTIQSLRDSNNGGNIEEAIANLRRTRDQALSAISGGSCIATAGQQD